MIANGTQCHWKQKNTKNKKIASAFGSVNVYVAVVACVAFAAALYLVTVNSSAVKGHTMRDAEQGIATLQEQQKGLRLREAELMSLHRVRQTGEHLQMKPLSDVMYITEEGPLVLRR